MESARDVRKNLGFVSIDEMEPFISGDPFCHFKAYATQFILSQKQLP